MATRMASVVIITTKRLQQTPEPESNILRFGAFLVPHALIKFSCKGLLNQLKSATEPAATLNGNYVAYAPVS
jgi:hypothetical protein